MENGQQGAWVGAGRQWEVVAGIQKRGGGDSAWVVAVVEEGYGHISAVFWRKRDQGLWLDWPWIEGLAAQWVLVYRWKHHFLRSDQWKNRLKGQGWHLVTGS